MDQDGNSELDFQEFEFMAVVLLRSVTSRSVVGSTPNTALLLRSKAGWCTTHTRTPSPVSHKRAHAHAQRHRAAADPVRGGSNGGHGAHRVSGRMGGGRGWCWESESGQRAREGRAVAAARLRIGSWVVGAIHGCVSDSVTLVRASGW